MDGYQLFWRTVAAVRVLARTSISTAAGAGISTASRTCVGTPTGTGVCASARTCVAIAGPCGLILGNCRCSHVGGDKRCCDEELHEVDPLLALAQAEQTTMIIDVTAGADPPPLPVQTCQLRIDQCFSSGGGGQSQIGLTCRN